MLQNFPSPPANYSTTNMQQRIIKFRAWHAERGMITSPVGVATIVSRFLREFRPAPTGFGSRAEEVTKEDFILEQFTGLLDKNGKEIYEGDIVQHGVLQLAVRIGGYFETHFGNTVDANGFGVHYADLAEQNVLSAAPFDRDNAAEVIGNIHENPELLNPTYFPPQGSVSLHEDEDNQLYEPAKDPSLEKEEQEPIPF